MNRFVLLVFMLKILSCQSKFGTDYCNKELCPQDVNHIACNNDGSWSKDCPEDATVVPLDQKLQNLILKFHNEKRSRIADCAVWENCRFGIAARMGKMRWNEELAFLAELNLRQCALRKTDCFATNKFPRPGQNLAYNKFQDEQNVSTIIQSQFNMWFMEYQHANMYHIYNTKQIDNELARNFLQLVRENADQVGCSVVRYTKEEWHYQHLACAYSSGYENCSPIYTTASIVGDGCKKGIDENYRNLCNENEEYDYNQCEHVKRVRSAPIRGDSTGKHSVQTGKQQMSLRKGKSPKKRTSNQRRSKQLRSPKKNREPANRYLSKVWNN